MIKEERNLIYKETLKHYAKACLEGAFHGTGLCWAIVEAHIHSPELFPHKYLFDMDDYPELIKHRPIAYGLFWWPTSNITKRIEVLQQAIQETNG